MFFIYFSHYHSFLFPFITNFFFSLLFISPLFYYKAHKFIFSYSYFPLFHLNQLQILKHLLHILFSHRHAKKTANKLYCNCINFKNSPVFLLNTICLFSVFFSITNRGFFASMFFYIYFTKLWLSLSLSLTASTVSYFISFVYSFCLFFTHLF